MRLRYLIARNCKLFFKDRGLSTTALIAPLVLLFLFVAFLGNVYKDSLFSSLPEGVEIAEKYVNAFAGGWLISSLLAVSAISISFTANLIMVQDRVTGRSADLTITPVSDCTLALGYFISTALITMLVLYVALAVGFLYLAVVGWCLSFSDVLSTVLDTFLLVMFGTGLSSLICRFIHSQGGITAVEVIVSAAYGFLCGAYMPISSLAKGLSDTLMFLPGTYGTSLLHEHLMGGAIDAMNLPQEFSEGIRKGFDCTLSFFDSAVPEWTCYLVLALAVLLFTAAYVFVFFLLRKRKG